MKSDAMSPPLLTFRAADNDAMTLADALGVLDSFPLTTEERAHSVSALQQELAELHDNRELYFALRAGQTVGMVQLILRNADNDP